MSDSKNVPKPPPPDDFSKTTPNIPTSQQDDYASDWEKTNYNEKFSPQPQADDWGKTVANYDIPPQSNDEPDFNKTYLPAQNPKSVDWGMTEANINLPQDMYRKQEDFSNTRGGTTGDYGKTTPYINLPENERARYEQPPPTPAEEAKKQEEEKKDASNTWLWVSGGLVTMFLFAIFVLLGVWYFFFNNTGFNVIVKSAPPQSRVFVDKSEWGTSNEDGTINLALKSGSTRLIEIKHPNYNCAPREIKGADGETQELIASCSPTEIKLADKKNVNCAVPPKLGEFEKAETCANIALDNLPQPNFSAEDLVKALNIFIINFDSGKFDIPSERLVFLKRAAEFIQKLPASTVLEVGGHTDDVGTDTYNQTLSENRAKSVKETLVKFGVKDSVLQTKGYGEANPKTTNSTEDGKFHNRRIEYSVIKQ